MNSNQSPHFCINHRYKTNQAKSAFKTNQIVLISFLSVFSMGVCENHSNVPIIVCIDDKAEVLGVGETTLPDQDCDGIIHADGSATKIHGLTGITSEKNKEWVDKAWPGCAKATEILF